MVSLYFMVGRGGFSCSSALNGAPVDVFNGLAISSSILRPLPPRARTLAKFHFAVVLIHLLFYKKKKRPYGLFIFYGGQGWIRTTVVSRRQIYSLFPLATRAPTLNVLLFIKLSQYLKIAFDGI